MVTEKVQSDELSQADFDYSDVLAPVDEDIPEDLLGKIKYTSAQVLRLAVKAKGLIKELVEIKKQFEHLTKTVMPELMKEAGMTSFVTNGVPIAIKDVVTASCPAPGNKDPEAQQRRMKILKWLDENKFGNLITREFKIAFDRNEKSREKASNLVKFLHEKGQPFTNNSTIHHMTLQSFAKQCLENGIELPPEFHVKQFEQAQLPAEYRVKWNDLASNILSSED